MPAKFLWCFLAGVLGLLGSCKNPDQRTSDLLRENFVHKSYILLYGRKASEPELLAANLTLGYQWKSNWKRKQFIQARLSSAEYRTQTYAINRAELMNFIFNPDSLSIQETIEVWKKMYPPRISLPEIKRLQALQRIPHRLKQNTLNWQGIQALLVHNSYYDFINMGTENFVVSMYHNFYERSPTRFELEEGKKAVEGRRGILAGHRVQGKRAFIRCFLQTDEYRVNQVRKLIRMTLNREANPEEMKLLAACFKQPNPHQQILLNILSGQEFASL